MRHDLTYILLLPFTSQKGSLVNGKLGLGGWEQRQFYHIVDCFISPRFVIPEN
jgi:hypothetical protein